MCLCAALASWQAQLRDLDSTRSITLDLIARSDFVGVVLASADVSNPRGQWKQDAYVYRTEPIIGNLIRDVRVNNQYPWVAAGAMGWSSYPTWFNGKGEYLVFLKNSKHGAAESWFTLATFRINYRPDSA